MDVINDFFILIFLQIDQKIKDLYANKRNDQPTNSVNKQMPCQDGCGPDRTVFHTLERQGDKQDDDYRVKNYRTQDSALRRSEMHDVKCIKWTRNVTCGI